MPEPVPERPSLLKVMLRAAGRAPAALGGSAPLVAAFLRSQINPDGGVKGPGGRSDLYYTAFGLQALRALGAEIPGEAVRGYLAAFGSGEGLDLVHLACLARCWAILGEPGLAPDARADLLHRIEAHRSTDAGYAQAVGAPRGSVYGCFLALGACQDLGAEMPDPAGVARCLASLRKGDGAYANEHFLATGSTPATAAAVGTLRHLGQPVEPAAAQWLLARIDRHGGFLATPTAPLPDLLSTATALHALVGLGAPLDPIRELCLDFIDSLWADEGAFRGTWIDETLDCEYTFYGLLALGHLGT